MTLVGCYIASTIIGAVIGIAAYIKYKPTLCDSCKYLEQKNGHDWKYRCVRMELFASGRCFDKAPTYCKYYERRDSNCSTQK